VIPPRRRLSDPSVSNLPLHSFSGHSLLQLQN
jgi:hypothetical protein